MAQKMMEVSMEIRYKRDLNSNYMILSEEGGVRDHYEVRMITENRIYGLLPCVCQKYETKVEYYYEITGRQSMGLLYERKKLDCKLLKGLLRELERVLEAAKEYLLNPNHFLLTPDSIYIQSHSERLYLCYYPGYEKEIRESFLELAEYLLGKLDKNDTEGIEFGYDLYQKALEPNFSLLEVLHDHAEQEKKPVDPVVEISDTSVQQEMLEKTGSWKSFFKKKSKKPQLEDYVAEADQMGSGSVIFLKEQKPQKVSYVSDEGTSCLQKQKREGLFLKCRDSDYPDFEVLHENFLIGKKKDSVDGCLPAPTISRLHARITYNGTCYFLEDLNSTNGTWVDQMQLNPYELFMLKDGMRVAFASVEYEVQL